MDHTPTAPRSQPVAAALAEVERTHRELKAAIGRLNLAMAVLETEVALEKMTTQPASTPTERNP